jgi:carbon-monoxide dehydrogenase large subunit
MTAETETMFGKAIKRREDPRLITGRGTYTDDIHLPGMQSVVFLRSPYAHARITRIDTSEADKQPGVLKVYTGKDFAQVVTLPCGVNPPKANLVVTNHPLMATDMVRHTGEIVAAVVADSRAAARDAADLIDVDYEPLGVTVEVEKATQAGATVIYDEAPNNIAFTWKHEGGDIDAAFQQADKVVKQRIVNQRLIPNAMEPRAVAGRYDRGTGEITLWDTDQNPHLIRLLLCLITGLPENKVRVISPDVGGGFGSKIFLYAEQPLIALITKDLGVPVKWTETRSENYLATTHGRDHVTYAEMAVKNDGTLLGLRVKTYANLGAYLSTFAPLIPTSLYTPLIPGVYTLPAMDVTVYGVFTNTVPVDAYRGAGRPEASYLIERMMDLAADELHMDPADIRRKNFVPADAFPFHSVAGMEYDSGRYEENLNAALEQFGYKKWRAEQEEGRKNGRYIGIGVAVYIEACGIAPSKIAGKMWGAGAGLWESAIVRVHPTGKVTVMTGSHSHGQGHETTFAQLASDELGIPMDDIEIVHGDTNIVPFGMGTYGSRSLAVGGTAILKSARKVVDKGKKIAAHLLEANEADIEYAHGKFAVKGSPDSAKTWGDVALMAYLAHDYPGDLEPGLEEETFFDPPNFTYPSGTYMAVVEVDPETGIVKPLQFYCMDDCGNVLNPLVAEGQVHGGVAQGIGQALYESAVYDENGQLLSGSMMDYAVPKITQLPMYTTGFMGTPSPTNPMGVKGIGEAGTIGSTPAMVNAVIDALKPLGVRHMDMPLTSQRVWNVIQNAQNGENGLSV